jgi:BirA family biotin operon repressor/biotin-[acetyl-CoA-carboxylase] ligase
MLKDEVLRLLRGKDGPVSGEQMSAALGVSRAAVWKAVAALRRDGYDVGASTRLGYSLLSEPDRLDQAGVLRALGSHPWRELVRVLPEVDSTNNLVKKLAAEGAPEGTVVIADRQTAGRGRRGRTFSSPSGVGIYLSVLLRPKAKPEELLHVTALVGTAMCSAVESVCGVRPGVKWTNDLVMGKHKLCGILTELSLEAETREVDYVVPGIGVNCNQESFPEELKDIAASLRMQTGRPVDRCALAAAMVRELYRMNETMFTEKEAWLAQFARDCVTLGQDVRVVRGDHVYPAHADGIGPDGELLVTRADGTREAISSGEVSIRGMYGYL